MPVKQEVPVRALTNINVGNTRIEQELKYFYWDSERNLASLIHTGALDGEIEFMKSNLEAFLNEDRLFVNDKEIPLHVVSCSIEFVENDEKQPLTAFKIESDSYLLKKGVNRIKLVALKEKVSYPCEANWIFPGIILKLTSLMSFEIKENVINMMVNQGEYVGGDEEFIFLNP